MVLGLHRSDSLDGFLVTAAAKLCFQIGLLLPRFLVLATLARASAEALRTSSTDLAVLSTSGDGEHRPAQRTRRCLDRSAMPRRQTK